jgi:hypothetical protein
VAQRKIYVGVNQRSCVVPLLLCGTQKKERMTKRMDVFVHWYFCVV